MLGGEYQKWTVLLYSVDLEPWLAPLGELLCTHAVHAKQARRRGEDGKWKSTAAAAYPTPMKAHLADACVRTMREFGLAVGSAKPHTSREEAEAARPASRAPPTAS
eukprot:6515089-Prymnesium_polylepis.1